MDKIKKFEVVCGNRPDFSEIIEYFKMIKETFQKKSGNQESFFLRTSKVLFSFSPELAEVTIVSKIDFPMEIVIVLRDYRGYKIDYSLWEEHKGYNINYERWNAVGVFEMIRDEILWKVFWRKRRSNEHSRDYNLFGVVAVGNLFINPNQFRHKRRRNGIHCFLSERFLFGNNFKPATWDYLFFHRSFAEYLFGYFGGAFVDNYLFSKKTQVYFWENNGKNLKNVFWIINGGLLLLVRRFFVAELFFR